MTDRPTRLQRLAGELKRRKVYRTAAVYATVAFVLWQATEIAVPALGLPDVVLTVVVAGSIVGFFLVLVLAWAFEIVPDAGPPDEAIPSPPAPGAHAPPDGSPSTGRRSSFRMAVAGGATLVLSAVLTLMITAGDSSGLDFGERDWIVIADVENHTGDDVFDQSLLTALTVALAQSMYVNVYPRNRVRETLQRMGREDLEHVDESVAREVAVRQGLRAVLVVEISSIGDVYQLTGRVVDPEQGLATWSHTTRARGRDEVLDALDVLSEELRATLGESVAAIQARSVPLPQATTSSLEALKLYSEGSRAWSASRWDEARSLWSEAVTIDSTFAWATASLAMATGWLDGAEAARPLYARARSLLDRVTERERLWIRSLIEAPEERRNALRAFVRQYPDDRDAWYNLGNLHRQSGDIEGALEAYRRSLAIDSMQPWPWVNTAVGLDGLGRYAESAEAFERAFAVDPGQADQAVGDVNRISGFVLAKVGDTAGARARFERLLEQEAGARANGLRSLALLAMFRGRYGEAARRLDEAIVLNRAADAPLSEYRNLLYLATAERGRGRDAEAGEAVARAAAIAEQIRPGAVWLQHLGHHHVRQGDLERARATLERIREDGAGPDPARGLEAAIALAEGRPARAAEILEVAYGGSPDDIELADLALAYLEAGELGLARQRYEALLERRPLGVEAQEPWLRAHYHAGRLHEAAGRPAEALAAYGSLAGLWADGDDDLPLLVRTRARIRALEGPDR